MNEVLRTFEFRKIYDASDKREKQKIIDYILKNKAKYLKNIN